MTAYFVAGSGTEVGKTYAAAALLGYRRMQGASVRAIKPLMSGFARDRLDLSDAGQLLSACGRSIDESALADLCLYAFEPALAPNVAARRAGVELSEAAIVDFVRERIAGPEDLILVESAGGVMSPATDAMLQIDLMAALSLPTIFVASAYLGAVSHSLTALEALDRRGLAVAAIVVAQPRGDGPPPEALIEELARRRAEPFAAAPFAVDPADLGAMIAAALARKPKKARAGTPPIAAGDGPVLLDATGYRCPMPVILLEKTLRGLPARGAVRIIADDPVAAVDIPHFAHAAGASARRLPDEGGACVFLVTGGGKQGG